MLWEHPTVGYYAHEPFESTYFDGLGLDDVVEKLAHPIDLNARYKAGGGGRSLVIKEMPYQVGKHAPTLFGLASGPVLFLLSHPRRNVLSRIRKKQEVGDSPVFPLQETGWELLQQQIAWCSEQDVPFLIVHAEDFSNLPMGIFPQVFAALGLEFLESMLSWRSAAHIDLDNLGGRHRHLYERVLASVGLLPLTRPLPSLEEFPVEGGFREHLLRCEEIYEALCVHPQRLRPTSL